MLIKPWTPLPFGRHKERTLPEVVLRDIDWFFWAWNNDVFKYGRLVKEAYELAYKARHIKIPKPDPDNWRIEYVVDHKGYFGKFRIVPLPDVGQLSGHIANYLDLSRPRTWKKYDKLGCRLMFQSFKKNYFGGARVTKELAEAFFSDPRNFVGFPLAWPASSHSADGNIIGQFL